MPEEQRTFIAVKPDGVKRGLVGEIIKRYATRLEYAVTSWDMDYFDVDENNVFKPNAMQKRALKENMMCNLDMLMNSI